MRGGVAVAVLLAVDEFERLQDNARVGGLLRELQEAEAAGAGERVSQEQVEGEYARRWGRPLAPDR